MEACLIDRNEIVIKGADIVEKLLSAVRDFIYSPNWLIMMPTIALDQEVFAVYSYSEEIRRRNTYLSAKISYGIVD